MPTRKVGEKLKMFEQNNEVNVEELQNDLKEAFRMVVSAERVATFYCILAGVSVLLNVGLICYLCTR